jgi:hypothetical protein
MKQFRPFLFASFFAFFFTNVLAQHTQENIDYIHEKELQLTNDSSYWDNAYVFYTGFNRVNLYNWSAGGMNFMELHGLADIWLDYKHNKFHWNNFIGLSLGVLKSSYGNEGLWLKNDDRIEITSKFSKRTPHLWDYSFLVNFRTQFIKGYYTQFDLETDSYMDNFLSPVYPIVGFGFDYHANNRLTAYISPITAKSTIVLDDSLKNASVFGLIPEDNGFRTEAGFYTNLLYTHDSLFHNKNLSIMSDLTLFSNYLPSKITSVSADPNNPGKNLYEKKYEFTVDVTLELLATYHINDFFSLTFSGYFIYDHDINIPRYEKDGITPKYLSRPEGEVDPVTGDNHYFIDYWDHYNNPDKYEYNLNYVEYGLEDGYIDPGDYEGYKIIKTGPALQFMEYWMLGLSFTF